MHPAASNSDEVNQDSQHGSASALVAENVHPTASNSAEVNQDCQHGSGSAPVDENVSGMSELVAEKRKRKRKDDVKSQEDMSQMASDSEGEKLL